MEESRPTNFFLLEPYASVADVYLCAVEEGADVGAEIALALKVAVRSVKQMNRFASIFRIGRPRADFLRGRLDQARGKDRRASILLPEGDPRPILASLLAAEGLPAPESLTYGELSLQELYRELYGTEGV